MQDIHTNDKTLQLAKTLIDEYFIKKEQKAPPEDLEGIDIKFKQLMASVVSS